MLTARNVVRFWAPWLVLPLGLGPWIRTGEAGSPAGSTSSASSGNGNSWLSSSGGTGNGWVTSSGGTTGSTIGGGVVAGSGLGGAGAAGSGPVLIAPYPGFSYGFGYGYGYGPGGFGGSMMMGGFGPTAADPVVNLPAEPQPAVRRPNPSRAREQVEVGDRLFRTGSTKKAEDRYRLALKSDPNSAAPRIRLAQVALVRGRYEEAADRIRAAINVEPGYLPTAPDIQKLYREPADFARKLADLETHLQADPSDRDAWFLLGAEWYLSGRIQRASDAFLRLTDRRPDPALSVFLAATRPESARPEPR